MGGLTPFVVTSIIGDLDPALKVSPVLDCMVLWYYPGCQSGPDAPSWKLRPRISGRARRRVPGLPSPCLTTFRLPPPLAPPQAYAPSFWMLALGGASLLGCYLMKLYSPRLNKPFVGRIE